MSYEYFKLMVMETQMFPTSQFSCRISDKFVIKPPNLTEYNLFKNEKLRNRMSGIVSQF